MASKTPEIKKVWRQTIIVDPDILPRIAGDDETARRYLWLLREGHKFPPLVVFSFSDQSNGGAYYLVDGSYRLWAYDEFHKPRTKYKVQVEIREGTRSEAIWCAAGANRDHGLPFTQAQREQAVKLILADEEQAKKSDRLIAKELGFSPTTIGTYRKDIQEGLPFTQERGVQIGQGVPPVTPSDSGGEERGHLCPRCQALPQCICSDSAGATGRTAPGAPIASPSGLARGNGSPPAPAEWPEPIKHTILEGTALLKAVASLCTDLKRHIAAIDGERRPGTAMFHVPAALERIRKLRWAITRAVPYCLCPECQGRRGMKPCDHCDGRGWLVRAETDETQATPGQIAQLEARGVIVGFMSKREAARQLDDIFAAETWQDRQKHQVIQGGEDSKSWD